MGRGAWGAGCTRPLATQARHEACAQSSASPLMPPIHWPRTAPMLRRQLCPREDAQPHAAASLNPQPGSPKPCRSAVSLPRRRDFSAASRPHALFGPGTALAWAPATRPGRQPSALSRAPGPAASPPDCATLRSPAKLLSGPHGAQLRAAPSPTSPTSPTSPPPSRLVAAVYPFPIGPLYPCRAHPATVPTARWLLSPWGGPRPQ